MTCEDYFIVSLAKGRMMRLSNDIILFSQNEGLFFVGVNQNDVLLCDSPRRHILVISREFLCQFIWLLEVDIFRRYIPVEIPAYIFQPCPECTVIPELR